MSNDLVAGSSPWLASLIGQAWAPRPQKLSSDQIQAIAQRGFVDPAALSAEEVRDICASVLAHGGEPTLA